MPIILRILLFISSFLSFLFVTRRLKKSEVKLHDTTFWVILSMVFVVLSLFPGVVIWLAGLIGIQSPINLVFLIIIFCLLAHCFIQSLRFSALEDKFERFVEEDALREEGKHKYTPSDEVSSDKNQK